MSTSGPLRPRRTDGSTIDATFELSAVPVFDLVYHHKAGARGSDRSVNADYHEGLELLLGRLAQLELTILGIAVDSGVARELEPADRELDLAFPIDLQAAMDVHELRLDITRAQKPVARRPGAAPRGGNDQKRIRITLTSDDPTLTFDALRRHLVEGGPPVASRAAEASDGTSWTAPVPASPERRAVPRVKDLIVAGILTPGTVVHARAQGREWRATILETGEAILEGEDRPRLFGQLTNHVAGHSQSAMRLWSVDRAGARVELGALRDELAARWALGNTQPAPTAAAKPSARSRQHKVRTESRSIDFDRAERFIESVPAGRWTSYKDVAGAAGSPNGALAIGRWLAAEGERIPGVWRVLTSSGVVSQGWRAGSSSVPQTPSAVHAQLDQEGVTFRGGRADEADRWTEHDAQFDGTSEHP